MPQLTTTAAFGFADFDPPVILSLYQQLGCVSCQFYRNEANPPTVGEAIEVTGELGLAIDSIHGVFGPKYDPSSESESERRAVVDVYRREGELALELGGPMVVVHPAAPAPDSAAVSETERASREGPLIRSMEELARIGEELGVVYLMENIPANYWCGEDPVKLAGWIRRIDSPWLRMCFDTGHALMTGTIDDRLVEVMDVVDYLHIHDNDAVTDSHLMPGDGKTDWQSLGRTILDHGIHQPLMLEVFYLEDHLRRLVAEGLGQRFDGWFDLSGSGKLLGNAVREAV